MSDKQSNISEKGILFHSRDKLLAKKKTPPKVEEIIEEVKNHKS
jgi:hypothetical protein